MSPATWTRAELASLCESLSVAKSDAKAVLIRRILIADGLAA